MGAVEVVLRKYDGRPHRSVTATRLGEDRHGLWLGTPAGTTVRFHYGDRPVTVTGHDAVRLIPRDGWWIAMFTATPDPCEVYCDVALPPRWTGPAEITVVDLDLDVSRSSDGHVELEDADEFMVNESVYGYPAEVVAGATAAAADLRRALLRRTEPFGDAYRDWLARL